MEELSRVFPGWRRWEAADVLTLAGLDAVGINPCVSLNARCTSYMFLGLRGNLNPARGFAKFEERTIRY